MKPTYADLQKDPWHRNIIKLLEESQGSPLPEPLQKLLVDIAFWGELFPKQGKQWVRTTLDIIKKVGTGATCDAEYDIFWIKLYAFFTEAGPYFGKGGEILGSAIDRMKPSPEKKLILAANQLKLEIEYMLDLLNDLDKVAITYVRHCRCHVHQNAYRVKYNQNRPEVIKENFKDRLLNQDIHVDVFLKMMTEAFDQVTPPERAALGIENSIAVRIANKLLPNLARVESALNAWELANSV